MARYRGTTQMSMQVERGLAAAVARAIEARRVTISDALATGLAAVLDAWGERELAAMMDDGRGTTPRHPLRWEMQKVMEWPER